MSDRSGPGGPTATEDRPSADLPTDARQLLEQARRLIEAVGGEPAADAECRVCPICRLIAAMREVRPEVVDHLAQGIDELVAALRAFAAPTSPAAASPAAANPATANPATANPAAANPATANPATANPATANPASPASASPSGSPDRERPRRPPLQLIEITD